MCEPFASSEVCAQRERLSSRLADNAGLDEMSDSIETNEIPVALLAQALQGLRLARGNPAATRQAVIEYFRAGVGMRLELGKMLHWLFFWPSQRESAFGQVGYSHKQGLEVLDMVKRISIEEIGLNDETSANKSWQPTPGYRLGAFSAPLARRGCTHRWPVNPKGISSSSPGLRGMRYPG
jgi:hypothetical protein